MTLKELRAKYNISQKEASIVLNIPIRTYRRYESDEKYGSDIKRRMFVQIINDKYETTEEKGILTIDQIKILINELFEREYKNEISFCILFGSYAKGLATPKSDVDLYVSSSLTGFRFAGLMEQLRQSLHKKVDVIRSSELEGNIELVNEIMKDGIRIYGK